MRVSELASLRDAAVDVEDGTITIIGKGTRERRVFVPDETSATSNASSATAASPRQRSTRTWPMQR